MQVFNHQFICAGGDFLSRAWRVRLFSAALTLLAAGCGDAASPTGTELVLEGLLNPTGLAFAPDGTLLVVESAAGRILKLGSDGRPSPLIEGFSLGTYVPYEIGPLSLLVRQDGTLLVGEGGESIGRERISFYDSSGASLADLTLIPQSGGNFYDLAIEPDTGVLYAASANTNRILRASPAAEGGGYGELEPFVEQTTAPPISYAAPSALAFEAGGTLLVGFSDFSGAAIVRLSTTAELVVSVIDIPYQTDRIITAIVVRSTDNEVYFAEASFTSNRLADGRVAKIVTDENGSVTVETVVDGLTAPSALAFAPDGSLYIATLGEEPNDGTGTVVKTPPHESGDPTEPAGLDESDESTDSTDGSTIQLDESTDDGTS